MVPLTALTQKNKPFEWGPKQEEAFQTLFNLQTRVLQAQQFCVSQNLMGTKLPHQLELKLETKDDGLLYFKDRL